MFTPIAVKQENKKKTEKNCWTLPSLTAASTFTIAVRECITDQTELTRERDAHLF